MNTDKKVRIAAMIGIGSGVSLLSVLIYPPLSLIGLSMWAICVGYILRKTI